MRRGEDPHAGTTWVFLEREGAETLHCSYCGSLSPLDALALLKDGSEASGSDWKYGWPHKFYIGDGKFYAVHLLVIEAPLFDELTGMIRDVLGVTFSYDATERLMYTAPHAGFQSFRGSSTSFALDPSEM